MTTITIKQDINLPKTQFENAQDLIETLYEFLSDDSLPELTSQEIAQADQAREDWGKSPEKFMPIS